MKNVNITKVCLFFLSLCIALQFTSCNSSEPSDQTQKEVITQIINNTITIDGEESNTVYATAMGLRSAVSIYCTFETTYSSGNPWNPKPTTKSYYSTGSGVIYKIEEGGSAFVITNHHVVYDSNSNTANHISDNIYLYLYGLENQAYAIEASYVGGSANYDIAVLRVEKSSVLANAINSGAVSAVTVADSETVAPGMTAIAIGNPSATDLSGISVSKGIISVDSEYITMTASDNSGEVSFRVIRTDAPINSGNSGGGLYNNKGELCGIVNAKFSSSTIENIGYAIPSNVVRAIADNIIYYCYGTECETVMRAIIGVGIKAISKSTVYDTEKGTVKLKEVIAISETTDGSLAESIFKTNDIINSVTIGDRVYEISRNHHFIDAMLDARVGDTISFEIIRGGETVTLSVQITEDCLVAY